MPRAETASLQTCRKAWHVSWQLARIRGAQRARVHLHAQHVPTGLCAQRRRMQRRESVCMRGSGRCIGTYPHATRLCALAAEFVFLARAGGARHCEGARVWGLCMRLARQKNTQWRMPEPFESHVSCLARGRKTSLNNPAPLLHTLCRVRRRPSGSNGSESPRNWATPCTRVHRCKGGTLAPAQSLGALKQQQVSASLSPRPSSPRDTAKMHSPATTCVHTPQR